MLVLASTGALHWLWVSCLDLHHAVSVIYGKIGATGSTTTSENDQRLASSR